jgi:hypothetical protein
VDARDEAFRALSRTLGEAIEAGGPGKAIPVCRDLAPEILRKTAAERKVAIGRTSFRRRNPANVPPPWAVPYVERRAAEPVWLASPSGRIAGLLPIRMQNACLPCHGPAEQIPAEVGDALARAYPLDEATGFRFGDLRGWFWVEVSP